MRLIREEQRDAAAATLAEAFHHDPLLHVLSPDESRRPRVGRWFFGVTVDYGMRWGRVWADEDASAVAVWLPPGSTWSARRSLLVGMGWFPLQVGPRAMIRISRAAPGLNRLHGAVRGPHWYLMAIGTRPARQGQGFGGALVGAGTSQADAAGVPCYLETGTPRNVRFFGQHGFEVTGEEQMHGYRVFGMVRQPHPAR
jgi:GNAT superfamily N-acetyltransferase